MEGVKSEISIWHGVGYENILDLYLNHAIRYVLTIIAGRCIPSLIPLPLPLGPNLIPKFHAGRGWQASRPDSAIVKPLTFPFRM